jgi:hypothetical protein
MVHCAVYSVAGEEVAEIKIEQTLKRTVTTAFSFEGTKQNTVLKYHQK